MTFREIRQFGKVDENLFEPEQRSESSRATTAIGSHLRFPGFLHLFSPAALTFSLWIAAELAIAGILLFFGVTLDGSYYGPASGRFTGMLATVFYQYRVGVLMMIFGGVAMCDAFKRILPNPAKPF